MNWRVSGSLKKHWLFNDETGPAKVVVCGRAPPSQGVLAELVAEPAQ
jgi:hypothetical protein